MLRWAPQARVPSNLFARYTFRSTAHARFMSTAADDDDSDWPHYTFPEEPLGLPANEGYGFFQGTPEDVLGADGRFQLQAKLGFGTNSSVWLAKDRQRGSHVALKILSGYASQLNVESKLRELAIHERLASLPAEEIEHCSQLITDFMHKGIEQDGDHLCLALELEQTTLDAAWAVHGVSSTFYPIRLVKRILRHMLHGMAALHKCGFAHTDIKPDNIMVGLTPSSTTQTIDDWARAHSPRVYGPCQSLYKVVTEAFVSNPLPVPSVAELETCTFKLGDFSNAQQVDDQTTDHITPLTLRPPELILGAHGVFTVITQVPLFPKELRPIHHKHLQSGVEPSAEGLEVDYILWLITLFTGQRYPPMVLAVYENSPLYFNEDGNWKRFKKDIVKRPLEICVRDAGCSASDEDVAGACSLMRRCLKLNPTDRPSALELLHDPWLKESP
ncbi:kinase-like domain-containing protein [Mycena sp. CBHHK59/15]|nr:kinase-like domain-containing protein [Mycena sp. CBHHK59/15]